MKKQRKIKPRSSLQDTPGAVINYTVHSLKKKYKNNLNFVYGRDGLDDTLEAWSPNGRCLFVRHLHDPAPGIDVFVPKARTTAQVELELLGIPVEKILWLRD